jgi:beta-ribofuranosylaminobenzene 5'-phosphate synthase
MQALEGNDVVHEWSAAPNAVRVRAPARLHLGFLDLNGGLGRRFGSLGLTLSEPALDLVVAPAPQLSVQGPEVDRVRRAVDLAATFLDVPDRVAVKVTSTIPPHAGFGSGTQLALAVAAGLARISGRPFDARRVAGALDRGNRSGVGLAAFVQGGFVVDGGRKADEDAPPAIARMPFPEAWRVLLILDPHMQGLHGSAERSAFTQLPAFPAEAAAHLCRVALMQVLPALVLNDLGTFGRGIAEIQRRVGDYFAPFQGGGRFTSPAVAEALGLLSTCGIEGIGQSSWGPTGFALLGSADEAHHYVRKLESRPGAGRLHFIVATGRNQGAEVADLSGSH